MKRHLVLAAARHHPDACRQYRAVALADALFWLRGGDRGAVREALGAARRYREMEKNRAPVMAQLRTAEMLS